MRRYLFFILLLCSFRCFSQAKTDSPVEHMDYLAKHEEELSKKYMSYMSEVAHGGKARKLEKRREDVVNSIRVALREAGKLRPYKSDASLRDAYREYWNVLLSVFNEDYHKIVDMEEVAERSYDAMEAYLMIQEKADEKLDDAYAKVKTSFEAFAAKNNVRLTESNNSKLNRKLSKVGNVNKYMNQLFLIYFKSTVQESQMLEAINAKDVSAIEQTKNSLLKFSTEGLQKLDSIKTYNGDGSMLNACRKVLAFQKDEAGKIDFIIDFLMKSEELEKMKKAYETKSAAQRSKEDADKLNEAVQNFNKSVNQYNKVNHELNTGRARVLNHYESTRKRFIDQHIPHA